MAITGFRVVRIVVTPALRFAPQAPPALDYRAGATLPPASCWRCPQHRAPAPECLCGYHAFETVDEAVEYAELFGTAPMLWPAHRFIARVDALDAVAANCPPGSFRFTSGTYRSLALAPSCSCGRPSLGCRLASLSGSLSTTVDTWSSNPTLAAACSRHFDPTLTAQLLDFIPLRPLSG